MRVWCDWYVVCGGRGGVKVRRRVRRKGVMCDVVWCMEDGRVWERVACHR